MAQRLESREAAVARVQPVPARIRGPKAGQRFRVAVIGAGAQGIAHCAGMKAVHGVDIAGIADLDADRLALAAARLQLPAASCFRDAAEMLTACGPLDLVSVATTAPAQIALGRMLVDRGVPRIVVEKPMGGSVLAGEAFADRCRQQQAAVAVNYSRRWSVDYRAIKACIDKGFIGDLRSIVVTVGRGELGMHGSHYFDLCRYLLASEPRTVMATLEPAAEPNVRGDEFEDPSGHCLVHFDSGARAFIDFSADLQRKDPFVMLKGTGGRITVDEARMVWTLQGRSNRTWQFPFVEPFKAATLFSRVVADLLSDVPPAAAPADGVAVLSMIAAAQLSHGSGRTIRFPLAPEEMCLELRLA